MLNIYKNIRGTINFLENINLIFWIRTISRDDISTEILKEEIRISENNDVSLKLDIHCRTIYHTEQRFEQINVNVR